MFDPGVSSEIDSSTLPAVVASSRSSGRALRLNVLADQAKQPRVVAIRDDIHVLGKQALKLRRAGRCKDLESVDHVSEIGRLDRAANLRANEFADQLRWASRDAALGLIERGKTALASSCRRVYVDERRLDTHRQQGRAGQHAGVPMIVVAGLVIAEHQ